MVTVLLSSTSADFMIRPRKRGAFGRLVCGVDVRGNAECARALHRILRAGEFTRFVSTAFIF